MCVVYEKNAFLATGATALPNTLENADFLATAHFSRDLKKRYNLSVHNKVITAISSLLLKKHQTLLSAAFVVMIMVLTSSLLGFTRERLLNQLFSADALGVYYAAFRLPNFLFELLIIGALSTAFIPVFTSSLVKDKQENAFAIASSIINLGVIVVAIISILLVIFARQISYILVPRFSEIEREQMILFTRIMIVGQLMPLILGNFMTGILQSFQYFLVPALAPVMYNVGIILGILILTPSLGMLGAVYGVVIGAVLFFLVQFPLVLKIGYRHQFKINLKNSGVREILKLMLPRMFGLAVSQIDTMVDLSLSSYLGTRFITIFYYAQRLQYFPVSLFGATIAQAALPIFSAEAAKKDLVGFKKLLLASLHQTLFFILPASIMLIVLRIPIVRLVYGAVKFDWDATVATGQTMSVFALSLFAQTVVQLFARAFYALHDTKAPVIVGIISVVTNTVLSIIFISYLHLPVWSLGVSTTIANITHASLLFSLLYKKVEGFDMRLALVPPLKMVVASLVTGVFLYVPIKLLDQLVFDTTRVFNLILLTGFVSITGLVVYTFLSWLLDIEEVGTFFQLINKVKRMPKVFFSQASELVDGERPPLS